MAILYKVTATTGKYTDKEGNERNRYVDMGVVMETKNGPMLKLEAVPLGWDGWAYLNEPKDAAGSLGGSSQRQRPQRSANEPADDFVDDESLPF